MSRFEFSLADERDDVALRRRMARDWMPGALSVSFRREPNYFDGCVVQGRRWQVVKCTDRARQVLVGMGSRLISDAYINGQVQSLGYLADLRSDPDYRRGTLLARGYRYFHSLHCADPVPLYTSVIWHDNTQAIANLTGARAGLPNYREHGRFLTPAIYLDVPRRAMSLPGVRIDRASREHMPEVWRLIATCHRRRQFAPVYSATDLAAGRLRGLAESDFYVAYRDGRLVGTAAAWDQSSFRQTHIERYPPWLRYLRPAHNMLARVSPLKPLPAPGERVPYFYLALVAIADDDVALFRTLLRFIYRDRRTGPWHYFIAGFHDSDPLAAAVEDYRRIPAAGRLYVVHYADGEGAYASLDHRIPYIEAGSL